MDAPVSYSKSNLSKYLKLDYWEMEKGLKILIGIDPEGGEYEPLSYEQFANDFREHALYNDAPMGPGDKVLHAKIMLSKSWSDLILIWNNSKQPKKARRRDNTCYYRVPDLINWTISKNIAIPWLEWAREINLLPQLQPQNESEHQMPGHGAAMAPHWGEDLQTLIRAANHFWQNADPDDPTTYPKNKTVEAWLEERGIARRALPSLSKMLRPSWANSK